MAEFLFEIGLEEVPARMIAGAEAELLRRVLALLGRERLLPESFDPLAGAKSYSTPRRLAVAVSGVRERQAAVSEEVTGPAVKIAYKDGVATPAAEAFARKAGVAVADLKTVQTPKGEYLAATTVKTGRAAAEVIAAEMPKELAAIYWAKTMYWLSPTGQGTSGGDPVRVGKPERFVRPVLWMACLLGETVVPVAFGGRVAGRATFGHRVLSSGDAFDVVSPESYAAQLQGEFVLPDVEARRHRIRKALDRAMREVPGARWREDHALVDAVTHLTEWPEVLLGGFEADFLQLPEEVLVTVMRDHQKYFAVENASGKLMPHFLTVVNIALNERNAAIIRQGNERVLRARFNDARFFWEFDQRVALADRVKLLDNVTFQKDLGSYAAKSERVRALAAALAGQIGGFVDLGALDEAARLAKTDLTTELVKEFTELQGVIGGLYAAAQGVSAVAAEAIYDQYVPAGMDGGVPRSVEGALLGIADRADTIAGMFGLGMEPTGSKDPFALRRSANGIVKILADTGVGLTLEPVIRLASKSEATGIKMTAFFRERLEFYLREVKGQAYDVVAAVMVTNFGDVRDAIARAEAISGVRGSQDFVAVCTAFKRMNNILTQASERSYRIAAQVQYGELQEGAEVALSQQLELRATEIENLASGLDYAGAVLEIARFGPLLTRFFEDVMVNVEDEDLRAKRLGLIAKILAEFSRIADFSQIVTAG